MKRVVWISGTFRLTNGLIDDLRAAGKFEGYAKAKGWPIRGGHDAYAEHQQAVRLAAKAAAVKQLPAGPLVPARWTCPSSCSGIIIMIRMRGHCSARPRPMA
jgi:hypothetical protein